MRLVHRLIQILVVLVCCQEVLCQRNDVKPFSASRRGHVQGVRKRWHRITIGFTGPRSSEQATPNPFTDYRLDVTFTHRNTRRSYSVPGYFAADGNAANSGAESGNVWLVHFAPDLTGKWDWSASFVEGAKISTRLGNPGQSAGFFDGESGNFDIEETDKTGGRDHRGKGRLSYVNKHHLRFANGEWFLKGGADSPENFLAYEDFDNTPNVKGRRKTWAPHLRDANAKVTTWNGGKGRAIQGALNYLAIQKGMNAFSFITMNIEGDDKNVFPYTSNEARSFDRMDVSKLAQWEVVFSHADKVGLFMHFKTQETENDQLLDGGELGDLRKLYYRELIARFSHHLALNWNMGEENSNTKAQQLDFAKFFKKVDPYDHPVVVHTYPNQQSKDEIFGGLLGSKDYAGISIQASQADIYNDTLTWVRESGKAGRPWVVANDEQAGAGVGIVPDDSDEDPDHNKARENVLWANLMAGGAGVEYYFGFRFRDNDVTAEDFRSRDQFWDQTRHALRFFRDNNVPFWNMEPLKQKSFNGKWGLATKTRDTIVMYLPSTEVSNMPRITLSDSRYTVRWFNPRTGGRVTSGSTRSLSSGSERGLGAPPGGRGNQDWVVLLRRIKEEQPTTTEAPRRQTPTIVPHSAEGVISGDARVGRQVKLAFEGPTTSDRARPSPSDEYRMTIWIFGPDSDLFSVTGEFAGNGDLSRLDDTNKRGDVWLANFRPRQSGRYWWSAEFRKILPNGSEVSAGFFDALFNTFVVE